MSLFNVRLFYFMSGGALNRRRLMDEYTAWASRFSRISAEAIGRKQISRAELDLKSVESYLWAQRETSSGHHRISGTPEQVRGSQISVSGYDGAGAYDVTWKVTGQVFSDATWFVYGFPFLGGKPLSGDFQVASCPFGLSYSNYSAGGKLQNGDEISLSGTASVLVNDDSPMYGGIMVGTNTSGVFNSEYASVTLRKLRNL